MPSNHSLEILPEAEDDLADILQYTLDNWGEQQAEKYAATIRTTLARLTTYPRSGEARPELFPGARVCPVGHHVVFYRIEGTVVQIVRILHQRMDVAGRFRGVIS